MVQGRHVFKRQVWGADATGMGSSTGLGVVPGTDKTGLSMDREVRRGPRCIRTAWPGLGRESETWPVSLCTEGAEVAGEVLEAW